MEYKLAHKFLYDKAIEKGFTQLAVHINKVGPLRIKVSKMDFVSHLSKIIIGLSFYQLDLKKRPRV